uniref:Uncharacterized protein n=1 Tax=Tanacetum cinerariifolium TaxID=118510 RepID=A0A6L2JIA6_TANCI|nr:hypothetical protein [Tanacetum cinerariifolium]
MAQPPNGPYPNQPPPNANQPTPNDPNANQPYPPNGAYPPAQPGQPPYGNEYYSNGNDKKDKEHKDKDKDHKDKDHKDKKDKKKKKKKKKNKGIGGALLDFGAGVGAALLGVALGEELAADDGGGGSNPSCEKEYGNSDYDNQVDPFLFYSLDIRNRSSAVTVFIGQNNNMQFVGFEVGRLLHWVSHDTTTTPSPQLSYMPPTSLLPPFMVCGVVGWLVTLLSLGGCMSSCLKPWRSHTLLSRPEILNLCLAFSLRRSAYAYDLEGILFHAADFFVATVHGVWRCWSVGDVVELSHGGSHTLLSRSEISKLCLAFSLRRSAYVYDIDIADRLLPTHDTPSGIPRTMRTTQIALRVIVSWQIRDRITKVYHINLQIAKVFEQIGAFYRENETVSAIMYKDEKFHVAMIELVNIGYGVNPQVRFASMIDIAQPADGSVCISDNGCVQLAEALTVDKCV